MKNIKKSLKLIRQKKSQKSVQGVDSGRSMVEMLGTLAIIGVLSIAGISGYNYAMKKYQANQVVSELNILSNQLQMVMDRTQAGEFELSLGAPYDEGKLTQANFDFYFGCGIDPTRDIPCASGETAYYELLSGVSKEECQTIVQQTQYMPNLVEQRVNNVVDTTGSNCGEEENEIALYFDKEAETEFADSCPPIRPYYNEATELCEACPAATPKWNGETGKCEACPTNFEWDLSQNRCVSSNPNIKCATNDDCLEKGKGYYCYANVEQNCWSEVITSSHCRNSVSDIKKQNVAIDGGYVASSRAVTWWTAQRFCSALKDAGKVTHGTPISIADFNCKDTALGKPSNQGGKAQGNCYDANKEEDVKAPLILDLAQAYGGFATWTPVVFNGCTAFYLYSSGGNVSTWHRATTPIVVCK